MRGGRRRKDGEIEKESERKVLNLGEEGREREREGERKGRYFVVPLSFSLSLPHSRIEAWQPAWQPVQKWWTTVLPLVNKLHAGT